MMRSGSGCDGLREAASTCRVEGRTSYTDKGTGKGVSFRPDRGEVAEFYVLDSKSGRSLLGLEAAKTQVADLAVYYANDASARLFLIELKGRDSEGGYAQLLSTANAVGRTLRAHGCGDCERQAILVSSRAAPNTRRKALESELERMTEHPPRRVNRRRLSLRDLLPR